VAIWKVACGFRHTALISSTGQLYTFGHGECGRLGLGDEYSYSAPQLVTKLAMQGVRCIEVACGREHSMAVGVGGSLYGKHVRHLAFSHLIAYPPPPSLSPPPPSPLSLRLGMG
jgi:alpha-tubulin suppressor-like RCC1 family protein